jgi:TIGR00730 family protein
MMLRSGWSFSWGLWRLSRLNQPIIAVFGGVGVHSDGKYAAWAKDFSYKITQQGMSVITGGGPGIMQAASCGALEGSRNDVYATLGIGVHGVDEGFVNPCATVINVNQFFVRKWLLTRYTTAFVLFPGGIGTVDELFDVLNLMKLGKMQRVPIILVGVAYWKDLIDWYQHAFEYELVTLPVKDIFLITDSIDEVVAKVIEESQRGA